MLPSTKCSTRRSGSRQARLQALDATPGLEGSVDSIHVACIDSPVKARVFIDASYDGDIMTNVGTVEYTYGREARAKYNETLAGALVPTQGPVKVNALRDDGSILKYVQNVSELGAPGTADDGLMAFQHRLCISGDEDRVAWKKPDGYTREDFRLFERYIEASGGVFHGFSWPPQKMSSFGYPEKKTSIRFAAVFPLQHQTSPT